MVERSYLKLFGLALLCITNPTCAQRPSYRSDEYADDDGGHSDNDFVKIAKDIWFRLGLDKIHLAVNEFLTGAVKFGQTYGIKEFKQDLKYVKVNPVTSFPVILRGLWSATVHSFISLFQFLSTAWNFIFEFLKQKCDEFFGKNSPYHPWNILRNQDPTHTSAIVLLYGFAILLILGRFLTWFQTAAFLSLSFLLYSYGGPPLVFKWLMFFTGLVWLVIDLIFRYPTQVSLVVILLFCVRYARGASTLRMPGVSPAQPVELDSKVRAMNKRIGSMERKTEDLQMKIERLTSLIEKIESDTENAS